MPKEYEAKFLQVNIKKTRKKLKEIGATKVHGFKKYRRVVFKLCNSKIKGYVRVRDENGTITMTSISALSGTTKPSFSRNFKSNLRL